MTGQTRLLGYADRVGKGVGFLIPVFGSPETNEILIQRIANDGTIMLFESVQNIDAHIHYIDPVSVDAGEEAIWAFAFAEDDILAERGIAFRAALANRIDDPALATRPFLAIEVAEFLGLHDRRLSSVRQALERMGGANVQAARTWFDISILTPDLRRALAQAMPQVADQANRVVATTDDDEVLVRGPSLGDLHGFEMEEAVRDALASLQSVLPQPRLGWRVRLLPGEPKRAKAKAADAVVWLANSKYWETATFIQDDFAWRVDAYRSEELDAFRETVDEAERPGFIVLSDALAAELGPSGGLASRKFVMIEFGSMRQLRDKGLKLLRGTEDNVHVYVPGPSLPGTRMSPKAVGGIVRQIVAASLGTGIAGDFDKRGGWVFLRAAGNGADPTLDGWAALYDRVWQARLDARDGFHFEGELRRQDPGASAAWAAETLFPGTRGFRDWRLDHEMQKARVTAAALLPAGLPGEPDWERHGGIVEDVLERRGWQPQGVIRGPGERAVELAPGRSLRLVQTQSPEKAPRLEWNMRDLLNEDLGSIEAVAVTSDAGASAILAGLQHSRTLPVNMRDLCRAHPRGGLWSLLGAQLQRMGSRQLHRTRTHFAAVLIAHAFNHSRVDFEEDGALREAIEGPTLGNEVQLTWGHVKVSPDETRAEIRLVAGPSNEYLPVGADLIAPFSMILHDAGIALQR